MGGRAVGSRFKVQDSGFVVTFFQQRHQKIPLFMYFHIQPFHELKELTLVDRPLLCDEFGQVWMVYVSVSGSGSF
jgi:hypothetical protein